MSKQVSPPAWFNTTAKQEWKRITGLVKLTPENRRLVESYCLAVAEIVQATKALDKEGLTVDGRFGSKAHPAARIRADAMCRLIRLHDKLGLSGEAHVPDSKEDFPELDD